MSMATHIHFRRPVGYCIRSAVVMLSSLIRVAWRRARRGPLLPDWNFWVEVNTEIMRAQMERAFVMPVAEARLYLDAVTVVSPRLHRVEVTNVCTADVKGRWFIPNSITTQAIMLYLHGGGYSFYPRHYANLITDITLASRCKSFALDYRLTPESRFPAQLEDGLRAYQWLLHEAAGQPLVLVGDSAGANLSLALLQQARERRLRMPDVVILLSPPVKFDMDAAKLAVDERFDWVRRWMLTKWADWFCDAQQRTAPLISPIYADLRGLPPIYIQDGRVEILHETIGNFVNVARQQGANVVLDSWDNMNHDFQFFGINAPQSQNAIGRIGEVVTSCLAHTTTATSIRLGTTW